MLRPLALQRTTRQHRCMFSIEHEFDSSVITLMDEGAAPLREDVIINSFAECVTVEQYDPVTDTTCKITLSHAQTRDLAAALDLPEGIYSLRSDRPDPA